MTAGSPTQPRTHILFSGYAFVHFLCFRPLYERLTRIPSVEVFVSGGLRTKTDGGTLYDLASMYEPFGVPANRMLTVEQIQERDFDVLFAANTTLIAPRNVGTTIQLFHGISFRNKSIRAENMGCDYYFLIGPYMRRKFAETGMLPEGDRRAVHIGFPKTDLLRRGKLDSAHLRQRYGFDARRPVLLYAPTGQKHNSLETMGQDVITRLSESGRYNLLIKLHDHPKAAPGDWLARVADGEMPNCRLASDLDVVPLMAMADLLITDASSVSNEFALLDRPMIFLDVPKLLERAREADGSMLDLDTWGRKGGEIVQRPEELIDAVDAGLAEPRRHTEVRHAMTQDLFFNPGSATDAAVTWLQKHVISQHSNKLAAR